MADAIRVVREAFADLGKGTAQNQARRRLHVSTGAVLHQLAGEWRGYFGIKIYSTHVQHGAHFSMMLYESATARPLALLEANHLGQIRTGAATGVATEFLARKEAAVLAVIGSGFQARTQLEAIRLARPLREVRVWSRNQAKREKFAAECGARVSSSAEECVRDADLIVTATYAKEPVLDAAWVAAGTHINAVGSNNPQRRELPGDLVKSAGLIVVDSLEQSRIESGDLLLGLDEAHWSRVVELQEVVAGRVGRRSAEEVTLFKSNGLGVEDVAAAALVYERFSGERG